VAPLTTVARKTPLSAVRTAAATVAALRSLAWVQDVSEYPAAFLPGWSARLLASEDPLGRGTDGSPFYVRDVIEVRTVHHLAPGADQRTTEQAAHDDHDSIVTACTGPTLRMYDPRHVRTAESLLGGGQYLEQRIQFQLRRLEPVGNRV